MSPSQVGMRPLRAAIGALARSGLALVAVMLMLSLALAQVEPFRSTRLPATADPSDHPTSLPAAYGAMAHRSLGACHTDVTARRLAAMSPTDRHAQTASDRNG